MTDRDSSARRGRCPSRSRVVAAAFLALALACFEEPPPGAGLPVIRGAFPEAAPGGSWRQWGGPNGDFQVPAVDLAESWPSAGPQVLWSRPLGEGYSAIVAGHGALFTMYRDDGDDVIIALRADDGATIWEHRYAAGAYPPGRWGYAPGPNATPLILADRLVALGFDGRLSCLALRTGELLWSLDLVAELGGQVLDFGNGSSPIPYGETVIVLTGGEQAVVAIDPADGSVVWRSAPGRVSYATPIVIDVDGQDQLVYASEEEILGLDARSGERLWSFVSVNENRDNISPPIWGEDRLLWNSMQPDGGTRVVRLERTEGGTEVQRVWTSGRIHIHFWNAIRLGDHVYASIGGQGLVFACIDVRTGEIRWRKRGFEKANLLQAGDLTILLDAAGQLALARLSPDGMNVLSRATVSDDITWTVPTLVATTLYIRDQRSIRALDLSTDEDARSGSS